MSDFIAGPGAGGARKGGAGPSTDGGPPPVLMAALGAAALIAIALVALFGRFGSGDEGQAAPVRDPDATPAITTAERERVMLSVTLLGSGDGVIQIQPGDIACIESCEHEFDKGTRVTVTADARGGSTFKSWGDACDGSGRCSIVMTAARALDATFDSKPTEPLCDDDLDAAADAACAGDDLDPGAEDLDPGDDLDPAPPAGDCADGRDNDRDGLTDTAQDPDCLSGSAEAGSGRPPGATAPPPAAAVRDCSDGRDNDGDGLTDTAQDPGCDGQGTEAD